MSISDRAELYGRRRNPMLTREYHLGREPGNKGKDLPPEWYTPEELAALMRCCGRGPGAIRNRAMIALQARSGMRAGEVLGLRMWHLDFGLGVVTVDGKATRRRRGTTTRGVKRRMVHMDPPTAGLLELWIDGPRARLNLPRGAPVFCTYERGNAGRPVNYAYYNAALKRAGHRAGIEKRMHTHGLRHTAAFQALLDGADILLVQQLLGHEDLGTTQQYVSHRLPLQMIRELQARAWPAAMLAAVNGHPNGAAPQSN